MVVFVYFLMSYRVDDVYLMKACTVDVYFLIYYRVVVFCLFSYNHIGVIFWTMGVMLTEK